MTDQDLALLRDFVYDSLDGTAQIDAITRSFGRRSVGYGREPSELEWRQANQIVLIKALGGVPWANSHGDLDFEERNRAAIERLKEVL